MIGTISDLPPRARPEHGRVCPDTRSLRSLLRDDRARGARAGRQSFPPPPELRPRAPRRPAWPIRHGERHPEEQPRVVDDAGEVPVGLDLVARLVVVAGDVLAA